MPIVWVMPDSRVQITQIAEAVLARERLAHETTQEAVARLARLIQAKTPGLAGATPYVIASNNLPRTRAQREAWRLEAGAVVARPVAAPEG